MNHRARKGGPVFSAKGLIFRHSRRDGKGDLPAEKAFSDRFNHHGDPLAAADAEGGQAVLLVPPLQLVQKGEQDPGSAGADGMAEGDGAAVDVENVAVQIELLLN